MTSLFTLAKKDVTIHCIRSILHASVSYDEFFKRVNWSQVRENLRPLCRSQSTVLKNVSYDKKQTHVILTLHCTLLENIDNYYNFNKIYCNVYTIEYF